jgi:hypothetical protein
MHPDELLKFLKHLLPWAPPGSYIRNQIQNMINQLKAQRQ